MAHTRTWNAANEASPAGTDPKSDGDNKIRELKVDIRERMAKDHYMDIAGTDADHGEHRKITFQSQIVKPAAVANKGFLYIKDVSAKAMLHWEDEDGNEVQIVSGTSVCTFPVGTKMIFYQDTAPTGWTIQNTLDDKVVYITKGSAAGGQTGGAVHSTGTWTQPAHTHTGPSHAHTTASHTLTGNEIPYHNHSFVAHTSYVTATSSGPIAWCANNTGFTDSGQTDYYGGGLGHSHGDTGASGTGATGGSATAVTWRPAGYNSIIAAKA